MHTIMVIGGGLVLLAVFLLVGRAFGGGSTAATAVATLFWRRFSRRN
jgi:hypothetical protein